MLTAPSRPARLSRRVQAQLGPDASGAAVRARAQSLITQTAQREVLLELPDFMFVYSLVLQNRLSIYAALCWLTPRLSGRLAVEFSRLITEVENGAELRAELLALQQRLPQPQLQEFLAKLLSALDRGTPIADLITEQAQSVRSDLSQLLIQQAGKNETKMLVPTVFLILPITVFFAIFPSLGALRLGL